MYATRSRYQSEIHDMHATCSDLTCNSEHGFIEIIPTLRSLSPLASNPPGSMRILRDHSRRVGTPLISAQTKVNLLPSYSMAEPNLDTRCLVVNWVSRIQGVCLSYHSLQCLIKLFGYSTFCLKVWEPHIGTRRIRLSGAGHGASSHWTRLVILVYVDIGYFVNARLTKELSTKGLYWIFPLATLCYSLKDHSEKGRSFVSSFVLETRRWGRGTRISLSD
ncbi:hypothetical protein VNO77_02315 [Canavalia gladiata]|uniref:Uncharacterized protein n=1 Tax=Canavalia gladiata TaxID=3824 RepID=A0AAN9MST8_CANGL